MPVEVFQQALSDKLKLALVPEGNFSTGPFQ
jgi:hypothetical protein